jgi:hypothetical protein
MLDAAKHERKRVFAGGIKQRVRPASKSSIFEILFTL